MFILSLNLELVCERFLCYLRPNLETADSEISTCPEHSCAGYCSLFAPSHRSKRIPKISEVLTIYSLNFKMQTRLAVRHYFIRKESGFSQL